MATSCEAARLIRTRCTGFAEEFLLRLEGYPEYPGLVNKLSELDGVITRADIENVLLEIRMLHKTNNP